MKEQGYRNEKTVQLFLGRPVRLEDIGYIYMCIYIYGKSLCVSISLHQMDCPSSIRPLIRPSSLSCFLLSIDVTVRVEK